MVRWLQLLTNLFIQIYPAEIIISYYSEKILLSHLGYNPDNSSCQSSKLLLRIKIKILKKLNIQCLVFKIGCLLFSMCQLCALSFGNAMSTKMIVIGLVTT